MSRFSRNMAGLLPSSPFRRPMNWRLFRLERFSKLSCFCWSWAMSQCAWSDDSCKSGRVSFMHPRCCSNSPTLYRRHCISWQSREMFTFTSSILVVREVWQVAITCRISALPATWVVEGEPPSLVCGSLPCQRNLSSLATASTCLRGGDISPRVNKAPQVRYWLDVSRREGQDGRFRISLVELSSSTPRLYFY